MLHTIFYLGLIAFVFTAGLEVDLDCIKRKGRSTLNISLLGIIIPFAFGYSMVMLIPNLWGIPSGELKIFALFMGTALSISALPVIARILIDLDLINKELGTIILTAAAMI